LLYVLSHVGYVQQCSRSSDVGDSGHDNDDNDDDDDDDDVGDGMLTAAAKSRGTGVDRMRQDTTAELLRAAAANVDDEIPDCISAAGFRSTRSAVVVPAPKVR